MRRHGLQKPLDPHQLASWVVFFALVSGVYAFYLPFVEDAGVKWFLVALYSVLVVAITALDLYTSYLDPSDPGLTGATDGEFFCGLCQASVARSSKHCRACDRCVEGFDHHCKWLNNCVGARNYWHFFGLISSTVSLLVLQLAWGLWLFIRSFTERGEMRALVAETYGKSVVYGGWQAALAIYMALLITSVVMLGELFFFHVVLISKGLTTYDYIIAQRDAKLAAPPQRSGANLKACRSSRVADTTTAKRKVRVGLNPCAAMRTSKPVGGAAAASYDAAKPGGGKGGAADGGGGGAPTTSPPPLAAKPALDGACSGSLGNSSMDGKEGLGLGISDKAAAAGSVQELVARAVAEQTVFSQAVLREEALLPGVPAVGGGGGGSGSGCVPECGGAGSSAGGAAPGTGATGSEESPSKDFLSLVHHTGKGHQQQQPQGTFGAAAGTAAAAGGGLGSAPGPTHDLGSPGGPGGFDAAAQPSGRHLGGHPASLSGAAAGPGSPQPSGPQTRPNSLPPLLSAPSLPCPIPAGGGVSRSLLFPAKVKSPPGTAVGSRRELLVTPE